MTIRVQKTNKSVYVTISVIPPFAKNRGAKEVHPPDRGGETAYRIQATPRFQRTICILAKKTALVKHLYIICEVKPVGRFKIPSIPPTTNKTIRFPNDVVGKAERAIQGRDCTFSAFVIAAVRAALEDLEAQQGR